MKLPSSAITPAQATAQGYKALTTAFDLEFEREGLNKAMQDMDRGKVDYVLVGDPGDLALSIWRKGMKSERDNQAKEFHTPSAGRTGATTRRKDDIPQ